MHFIADLVGYVMFNFTTKMALDLEFVFLYVLSDLTHNHYC